MAALGGGWQGAARASSVAAVAWAMQGPAAAPRSVERSRRARRSAQGRAGRGCGARVWVRASTYTVEDQRPRPLLPRSMPSPSRPALCCKAAAARGRREGPGAGPGASADATDPAPQPLLAPEPAGPSCFWPRTQQSRRQVPPPARPRRLSVQRPPTPAPGPRAPTPPHSHCQSHHLCLHARPVRPFIPTPTPKPLPPPPTPPTTVRPELESPPLPDSPQPAAPAQASSCTLHPTPTPLPAPLPSPPTPNPAPPTTARPMPESPPVMSATLSCTRGGGAPPGGAGGGGGGGGGGWEAAAWCAQPYREGWGGGSRGRLPFTLAWAGPERRGAGGQTGAPSPPALARHAPASPQPLAAPRRTTGHGTAVSEPGGPS
jgi:hypothetical protein